MEKRYLWMPLTKTNSGTLQGILSDDSIDRDTEIISPLLIEKWAHNRVLPMLVDHKNQMSNLAGVWKNFKMVEKNGNKALIADLHILKSNPNTSWMKEQIEEMEEHGKGVGVSIGAIPKDSEMVEKSGRKIKMHTDAELVEATLTPIPSNRNTFTTVAKSFDIKTDTNEYPKDTEKSIEPEITKPKKVEDCVKALMADPKFKPKGGRSKEESAWAVCQAKFGKECHIEIEKSNDKEEIEMSDEKLDKMIELQEKVLKALLAKQEEPKPEEPKEEPKEEKEEPPKEEKKLDRQAMLKAMPVAPPETTNAPVEVTKELSLRDMQKWSVGDF